MKESLLNYKLIIVVFATLIFSGCKSKIKDNEVAQNSKTREVFEKTKHNILFISIDDFKPFVNKFGATKAITPNIDKLASESVQFNNAYTNIAVCGASRASVMTGVRPSQTRFTDYNSTVSEHAPDAMTLNHLFQKNGYATISYGKIYHNVNDSREYWDDVDKAKQTDYQDPKKIALIKSRNEKGEYGLKIPIIEYPEVDDYAYNDGKITKNALRKMKTLKEENKPFFMAVGYVSPHLPFIQPKKYWDMYNHGAIELADNPFKPENAPDIAMTAQHDSAELRGMYLDVPQKGPVSIEMAKDLIHGYYASVSYMDKLIGDLIQGLEDLGLRDNTSIVLWSDHGYFLGEHGMWTKHSTFNEAVKIPLLISSPKYTKNKTTESFTELVDIYPTLCDLTNIEKPAYLHGESLIPVLENPSTILKSEIYTRYHEGEAVIDKDYSYTEFYRGDKYLGNMLYDENKDIKQNIDISKRPENKEIVDKYSKKLEIMRNKVNKKINY